jgi:hypothetical protein
MRLVGALMAPLAPSTSPAPAATRPVHVSPIVLIIAAGLAIFVLVMSVRRQRGTYNPALPLAVPAPALAAGTSLSDIAWYWWVIVSAAGLLGIGLFIDARRQRRDMGSLRTGTDPYREAPK